MTDSPLPSHLCMPGGHLSTKRAREYVNGLALSLGISTPAQDAYDKDMLIDLDHKPLRLNFKASVNEAIHTGVPKTLQSLFDARDPYLAPAIEIAIGPAPPGVQIDLGAAIGSYHAGGPAPGLVTSPEVALAEDILHFRRTACEASHVDSFAHCARSYRCYLQSCLAVVDCFLFRYASYVKNRIPDFEAFSNTRTLGSAAGIEKRLDAWVLTFATDALDTFKRTKEWSDFQMIRQLRNRYVHPSDPVSFYSLKEIGGHLNLCRRGVGGLLRSLREYSRMDKRIGFIQRVATAPEVVYSSQTDT